VLAEAVALVAEWSDRSRRCAAAPPPGASDREDSRELAQTYANLLRAFPTRACVDALAAGGADVERLLLATALLDCVDHSIELARHLIARYGGKGTVEVRRDRRFAYDVGKDSSHETIKDFFLHVGVFLGRYKLYEVPPVHSSKTCLVLKAFDVDANVDVALKLMKNRDEFKREVSARLQISGADGARAASGGGTTAGTLRHSASVIGVYGWHTPAGGSVASGVMAGVVGQRACFTTDVAEFAFEYAAQSNLAAFPNVLVMECGGQSLFNENVSMRIAGVDAALVANEFSALAQVRRLKRHFVVALSSFVSLRSVTAMRDQTTRPSQSRSNRAPRSQLVRAPLSSLSPSPLSPTPILPARSASRRCTLLGACTAI
jgi:hypothetical protein